MSAAPHSLAICLLLAVLLSHCKAFHLAQRIYSFRILEEMSFWRRKRPHCCGKSRASIKKRMIDGASSQMITNENFTVAVDLKQVNKNDNNHRFGIVEDTSFELGDKAVATTKNKFTRSHSAWEEKYKLLLHYYQTHGHTLVPTNDPTLGRWVQRQRAQYKKGIMPESRINSLSSLKFIFDVHQYERSKKATTEMDIKNDRKWRKRPWEERYEEQEKWHSKYGHSNVPLKFGSLGGWVQYQRRSKAKLSDHQLKKLDDLGFIFDLKCYQWNARFKKLEEFIKKNGHSHLPSTKEFMKLQAWCGSQRYLHRIKHKNRSGTVASTNSPLTDERERLLSDIGFDWGTSHEYMWHERIKQLREYKINHGHVNVPKGYGVLGAWVDTQRTEYRFKVAGHHTHLTEERVEELENLGFIWSIRELQWNEKYNAVFQYAMEKKHSPVKVRLSPSLAIWFRDQKKLYRAMRRGEHTPLSKERSDKLRFLLDEYGTKQ